MKNICISCHFETLSYPPPPLWIQYIPRNMHTVFALLCFVVDIHWLIFPYPSGLLHWHCGNLTIAPVPAKQPWWIWINTSCEFIMNDCITTTTQSTTKPCAYFLGYTVTRAPLSYIGNRIVLYDLGGGGGGGGGGDFKNTYELLNLRALRFSTLYENCIFQCMGKIFCVEFQREPLKLHTQYLTHTLKDLHFI